LRSSTNENKSVFKLPSISTLILNCKVNFDINFRKTDLIRQEANKGKYNAIDPLCFGIN